MPRYADILSKKILIIFHRRFKMVITAYHFKGIKISNHMNMEFLQFVSSCKKIDAVRELT